MANTTQFVAVGENSRTCLASKGFTKTNRRRYTGQQPGTKSAPRPGDKPLVNRGFCSSVGFKDELDCSCFRRFVQDSVNDSLEGKREGCLRARSSQRHSVLPSPAPPRRFAVRRSDPTGPRCVRVLDSTSIYLGSSEVEFINTLRICPLCFGVGFNNCF